ncbi:MAG: hypothetical protein ACU0GG_00975 [Paracoccaceae bacterium]
MTHFVLFHTPEPPAPLGLDLAELSGGGSLPSQFYGMTHDGREVYVRYRGGGLRVEVAKTPGADLLDSETLLDIDIGPYLDGYMTLARFCAQFGVTVNGSLPGETDPRAHRQADFSGKTTYWDAIYRAVSNSTAREILETACAAFPGCVLCQVERDESFKCVGVTRVAPDTANDGQLWLIPNATLQDVDWSPEDYVLPKAGQLQMWVRYPPWQFPTASQQLDLSMSFPTGDPVRDTLKELGKRISALLG